MPRARDIAAYLLHKVDPTAGEVISNLSLQKLLYFSQAWHLALYDESLFNDDFEAWVHGPVVPAIWHLYKGYGWMSIQPPAEDPPQLDEETRAFLDQIWARYGEHTGRQLERMTHGDPPWLSARTRAGVGPAERCNEVITKEDMEMAYKSRGDLNQFWNPPETPWFTSANASPTRILAFD